MTVHHGHCLIPKRYLVTALAFVGCFSMYQLRTTLGIALVDMTSERTIVIGNRTEKIGPEYQWDSIHRGYVLSIFAIGNFCTFLCSSVVVKLGGVTTFGVVTLLNAIVSLLTPLFLRIHLYLFIVGRALQGLFLGVGTVGVIDTFTHWSPPEQRVRLTSYYFMGSFGGIAFSYPIFGFVARHFGWPAIFYTAGGFGVLWCAVWLMFVSNDPSTDKFISEEERTFLKMKIQHVSTEKMSVPWKKILTSSAVWAFINEYFTISWCASFIFFCIPLYIKDMYDVDILHIGLLGGLPMVCSVVVIPISAYLADYLRSNVFSIAKVHKMYLTFGNLCAMLVLGIIALSNSFPWSIFCFCLVRTFVTFPETSYASLPIDIAGQYSGVVKGMALSAGGVAHFLNPILIGHMVPNHTREQWNLYFLFLTFISLYGVIMFYIFGSGELQSWAKNGKTAEDVRNEKSVPIQPVLEMGSKNLVKPVLGKY